MKKTIFNAVRMRDQHDASYEFLPKIAKINGMEEVRVTTVCSQVSADYWETYATYFHHPTNTVFAYSYIRDSPAKVSAEIFGREEDVARLEIILEQPISTIRSQLEK